MLKTLYSQRISAVNIFKKDEKILKNPLTFRVIHIIIKIAMVKVYHRLLRENLDAKLIMQVHDELIVECNENDRQAVEIILKQEMENACKMKVKLLADVHSGKTWYDAKG